MAGLPPGFDMNAMQSILNNPEIRQMAEQMAADPSFQAITSQLANMGLGPTPAAGQGSAAANASASRAAPEPESAAGSDPATGGAARPGAKPEEYMNAMHNIMQNPDFAKMAEDLGKKMFESDPQLAKMVQTMQDPSARQKMEEKMATLKQDPELKDVIEQLETGGPAAMMKYWNDAETMQKIGKAFGDMPGFAEMMAGGAMLPGAAEAEGEGENDAEEEVDSEFLAAAMDGNLEEVKKFIEKGGADFDVNEQDSQGRSALHFACGYGELEVVKELLANKASVTSLDSDRNTPLHYAAGYGEAACVKLLLDHGAGITEKNGDGKTPLDVAQLNDQTEIAKMLKDQEKEAFL